MTRWEQLGTPSSHWTTALADNAYTSALVGLFFVQLFVALTFPLTADELYYWTWTHDLQWSYYDHPVMVAIWMWISTSIFGDNTFAIRIPAIVATLTIMWTLGKLCRHKSVLFFVLGTPIVLLLSVIHTPDIPLLFFWTLYLFWLAHANSAYRNWTDDPLNRVYHQMPVPVFHWGFGGILLGLGMLSKYTMVFACLATICLFIFHYQLRSWLLGMVVHLATAAIVSLPILIYNWNHDFIPLAFQWNHGMGGGGATFSHFWNFLGGQFLLVGLLPFLLLPWVLIRTKRILQSPMIQPCYYFFLLPFLFFMLISFRGTVEGNWPIIAYIGFWPIAQMFLQQNSFALLSRSLYLLSFGPPLVATLIILVHNFYPLEIIPPSKDRLGKIKEKHSISEEISADVRKLGENQLVFLPTYQWTAYFRFHKINAEQLYPSGRQSHFTMNPKPVCDEQTALVLEEGEHRDNVLNCFKSRTVIKSYPFIVRDEIERTVYLTRYGKEAPTEPL